MKNKKDGDLEITRRNLDKLIQKRYKRSFMSILGDFFEKIIIIVFLIISLISILFITIMLIENPLSLLILFVGIVLIILSRRIIK